MCLQAFSKNLEKVPLNTPIAGKFNGAIISDINVWKRIFFVKRVIPAKLFSFYAKYSKDQKIKDVAKSLEKAVFKTLSINDNYGFFIYGEWWYDTNVNQDFYYQMDDEDRKAF